MHINRAVALTATTAPCRKQSLIDCALQGLAINRSLAVTNYRWDSGDMSIYRVNPIAGSGIQGARRRQSDGSAWSGYFSARPMQTHGSPRTVAWAKHRARMLRLLHVR